MHISKKHKFVFLDVPKTASLTLDTIFEKKFGAKLNKPPRASKLGQKHSRIIPGWAKEYTKITCVRNPFERISSFYFFTLTDKKLTKDMGIKTFDDFIDHCLKCTTDSHNNQKNGRVYRYFPAWKFLAPMGYDIVLKQETLAEDFSKLPFVNDDIKLPEKNRNSKNKGWQELYTPERHEKVVTWAGEDFKLFGYDQNYKGKQT